MTAPVIMPPASWVTAECHLIAQRAYERFIDVEPWQVSMALDLWRQWYYGMVPWNAVLSLPGVRRISVSGK